MGGLAAMSKKDFVYGDNRFRPHRCIQCKHFFDEDELFSDWFSSVLSVNYSETITCPVCGVENCR